MSSVTVFSFHPPKARIQLARTAQFDPPYAGSSKSDWRPYSLTR